LIDGFPRNEDNRTGWNKVMGDITDLEFVLFLEASRDNMIKRIKKRIAETAGNVRSDDKMDVLVKRFDVFTQTQVPIINLYDKLGKVRNINADRDPDAVYNDVKKLFK